MPFDIWELICVAKVLKRIIYIRCRKAALLIIDLANVCWMFLWLTLSATVETARYRSECSVREEWGPCDPKELMAQIWLTTDAFQIRCVAIFQKHILGVFERKRGTGVEIDTQSIWECQHCLHVKKGAIDQIRL